MNFESNEKKLAYAYAIKLLSRKAYTTYEIKEKLYKKGHEGESVKFALEKLRIYLDDEDLLKRLIQDYLRQGKGPLLVLMKVQRRTDIPKEFLKEWIEEASSDVDLVFHAKRLVEKKYKELDLKSRQKAYRFLIGRGFSPEIIQRALNP